MNKNNNKKNQFNTAEDTQLQLQAIRDQVLIEEVKARHWKAMYENAHYHMLFDELLPKYTEFLDRLRTEREEADKKQKEYFEELDKLSKTDLKGSGLVVEELVTEEKDFRNYPGVNADGSQGGA